MTYVRYRTCKGVDIIFRDKAHAQCNPVCNCASRDGGESACFEMAESLPEFRCWVCSLSFDAERKFLRHLTTPKHAEMEDILYHTEAMELESNSTPKGRPRRNRTPAFARHRHLNAVSTRQPCHNG